jgi:putative transposase
MKLENVSYSTQQIWIKPGHRMFSYFQTMCENCKNLYNTTNFYIRQVYTSFRTRDVLHPLQQEVIETLKNYIQSMNVVQKNAYQKRLERELKREFRHRRCEYCKSFNVLYCLT